MNDSQDRALSELIRAVGQPDFPATLSYFFSKLAAFDNLLVIAYYKDHNPHILYREGLNPAIHKNIDSHYIKAAYLLDPFYHAICNGIQRGVYRIFDIAPDQFKQTSYFKEYYQQTTNLDEVGIFARINHDTTITACFGRDCTSNKSFTKNEIKLLKSFEKVLMTLCEMHWKNYQPPEGKGIMLGSVVSRLRSVLNNHAGIALSPRQAEVALLILQGHSSLSISLNLNISKETVKVFRKQLYSKCNISSQAELFALLLPMMSLL